MKRDDVFWGLILLFVGILFLLGNLGWLTINVWGLIWPLALILLGLSAIWGYLQRDAVAQVEELAIPLQGAHQADVHLRYGAGRLRVDGSAAAGNLVDGRFGGGVKVDRRANGGLLSVSLERSWFGLPAPWNWDGRRHRWSVGLNRTVPLALDVETGASQSHLDLADLQVRRLRISTGASETEIILPRQAGHTEAAIRSGVSEVTVRIPQGVAARIRSQGGLSEVKIDTARFPGVGDLYQSTDFAQAENKVDLSLETGMGEVNVH